MSWGNYWASKKYLPEAQGKIYKYEILLKSLKRCKTKESMIERINKFQKEIDDD